jgi:hypothetical protein
MLGAKPPAAAAFAYSKDWLVTELHRLSSFHQLRAPAVICIPGFLKEIKMPAGGCRAQPGRLTQIPRSLAVEVEAGLLKKSISSSTQFNEAPIRI